MNGLSTTPEAIGLTQSEAKTLLEKFGHNELRATDRGRLVRLAFNQLASPLVLVLLIAAAVAFSAGLVKDAYLILAILLLNASLGFSQEYKAEKALQALKKITVARTRVIRNGVEQEIPNKELVPGDLIIVGEGQVVPADAILLDNFSLEINESALTGESLPILKTGGDKDTEQIYMGTVATSGRAKALVLATGMRTRFGRLAQALKAVKDEPTPFQKSMARLARGLALLAIVSAVVVYFTGVGKGIPNFEIFLIAASLAVAAVPEGLPAIVGLSLAVGVERMARRRAIVRKMSAVEALGAVNIICTDKTGTITTGNMKARFVGLSGMAVPISALKGKALADGLKDLLQAAVLNNSSSLVLKEDGGSYDIIGTPTDGALLVMASELGFIGQIRDSGRIVEEFPFDKSRKLISAVAEIDGNLVGLVRGAPERILERSINWLKAGKLQKITDEARVDLSRALDDFAARGFRVIGFAKKSLANTAGGNHAFDRDDIEANLDYIGFIAISDPPRPEVAGALKKAGAAGVKTMMLTGDNILTAKAIGEEVGLLQEGDEVILGEQLDQLTDGELDEFLPRVRIVARATPEQKLRVVQSLQRNRQVVAVTGDGVNDSLALKQADVGVAMGITGTDVAKQASDIILTDDQYATIVAAIEEGRRIDDNLTRAVRYLVAGNLSEILTVLLAVAFISSDGDFVVPLLPVQILWVNIVTDALPAFALATSQADGHAMRRGPKKASDHPLNPKGLKWVIMAALAITFLTLLAFYYYLPYGLAQARTAAFTTLIVGQMIMAWVVALSYGGSRFRQHKWLALAVVGTILIQGLLLVVPPLREAFQLVLPWR